MRLAPAGPARTTMLVGLALAVVLVLAYAVVSLRGPTDVPVPTTPVTSGPGSAAPTPSPLPSPSPSRTPEVPQRGRAYPVSDLGALRSTSVLTSDHGNADLRYRRAAGNGTRVHFICTGCDADTWVVEQPRGAPLGGGPLGDPSDATGAVDTVDPGRTTDLLVRAAAGASWTLTLTPFAVVPLHEQTFDALDDDVVAVRVRGDLQLTCGGPVLARTLARPAGAKEYAFEQVLQQDSGGTFPLAAPRGTDQMVVAVSCAGRWTLTLP